LLTVKISDAESAKTSRRPLLFKGQQRIPLALCVMLKDKHPNFQPVLHASAQTVEQRRFSRKC
jgi:hypothetical protein